MQRYLIVSCAVLMLLVSACRNGQSASAVAVGAQQTPTFTDSNVRAPLSSAAGASPFAAVSFTASTSYATALRLVMGLGLQLQQPCQVAVTDKQGKIIAGLPWSPVGRKEFFQAGKTTSTSGTLGKTPTVTVTTMLPELFVLTTALAPVDWIARLHASSNVSKINTRAGFGCPNIGFIKPPMKGAPIQTQPGVITSIAPQRAGTYVAVTFAAKSYDDALYLAANLGFRLAVPCYEQEVGKPADWHPMGQQDTFARTHMLILATTDMSPTDWSTRTAHTPGVTKVDASYQVHC